MAQVDVAGPGFLNVTVEAGAQGIVAAEVVAAGSSYGASDAFAGEKINLEFVSANPTGPLHIGGVRWAAVGDALGRIFTMTGADVTREYYFNDHGAQIDRFSRSLLASATGRARPGGRLRRRYIAEIAKAVVAERPDALGLPDDEAQEVFRAEGVDMMFAEIKKSLHDFGVDFDVYFHEKSLHESGAVDRAIKRLTEMGNTYEQDGALWLATEKYGDDKDRVIIKSDGQASYISGDLAYYLDKRERGFDRCYIMLGADHHGYVARMHAMCAAFGDEPGKNLEILIGQMVNLVRAGQPLRMSKRAGDVITIDDLVGAIGVDASRYALARFSSDSTIDLDLDLWAKQSSDNPVYYVQYAHARVASILRNGADLGLVSQLDRRRRASDFDPPCWRTRRRVSCCGRWRSSRAWWRPPPQLREPHRVARYLEATAASYHRSTTTAGCCRWATSRRTTCTGPGSCSLRPRRPCSPTASPARGLRARADVAGCPSHEAGWAHADGALRARPGCASPPTPTPWSRCCGRRPPTSPTAC